MWPLNAMCNCWPDPDSEEKRYKGHYRNDCENLNLNCILNNSILSMLTFLSIVLIVPLLHRNIWNMDFLGDTHWRKQGFSFMRSVTFSLWACFLICKARNIIPASQGWWGLNVRLSVCEWMVYNTITGTLLLISGGQSDEACGPLSG